MSDRDPWRARFLRDWARIIRRMSRVAGDDYERAASTLEARAIKLDAEHLR